MSPVLATILSPAGNRLCHLSNFSVTPTSEKCTAEELSSASTTQPTYRTVDRGYGEFEYSGCASYKGVSTLRHKRPINPLTVDPDFFGQDELKNRHPDSGEFSKRAENYFGN